ncbi:DUF6191 domain-containing protein [Actinokineospora sp. HUAS TT18]|uniref:DUF6191 domain-containing protein n=1 Tax=Actinokineospora sp. HUAS TT18 TaxID=3447451 RepID=UPI003F525F33
MTLGLLFALSLPGLVCGLIALAAVERLGSWSGRRRLRRDDTPVSAVGLEELDALFSGGKRVELDERKSHTLMRDEEEAGAPPRTKVDLDRGVVRIVLPD